MKKAKDADDERTRAERREDCTSKCNDVRATFEPRKMYHANAAFAVGTYHTNAHFRRAITTKTILINAKSVTIKVTLDKGSHGLIIIDEVS